MKPFNFSLEALRTLRRRQEQRALETYARAVWNRQQAALALQAARQKLEATWLLSQQEMNNGSSASFVSQLRNFCRELENNVTACRDSLEKAEKTVAETWRQLLEIRQEREAVDKLHDRRREEYDRELLREEQKLLDEMALRRRPAQLSFEVESGTVWN